MPGSDVRHKSGKQRTKASTDGEGTGSSTTLGIKQTNAPVNPSERVGCDDDTQPILISDLAKFGPATRMRVGVLTDVGRVREKNEDNALTMRANGLFVVADGMGGHNSGEVASKLAVDSVRAFYEHDATDSMLRGAFRAYRERSGKGHNHRAFDEFRLWKALEAANLHIFNTARQHEQFRDMGTTIVAVHFVGARVYIGHVGDSRVYRIRNGQLKQLTDDHSLANEYVKMKILRKEDLPRFPYKNVIVRALGLQESVQIDTFYREAKSGDQFLLCSDGLTDLVEDKDILKIVLAADSPTTACEQLVAEANDRGGVDNITALVVEVGQIVLKSDRRKK